jgi:hypothetical protein
MRQTLRLAAGRGCRTHKTGNGGECEAEKATAEVLKHQGRLTT